MRDKLSPLYIYIYMDMFIKKGKLCDTSKFTKKNIVDKIRYVPVPFTKITG